MSTAALSIVITAKDATQGVLGNIGKQLDGMGSRAAAAAKAMAIGAAVGGTAVAGIGVASIKAAADFEAGMREVATLSPEIADNFKEISAQVAELSARMGQDAVESSKALYQAISAGVPAENAISFMEVASKAAIAGVTDTETAVNGLTNIINAWGLSADQAGAVADSMFAAVKGGKTTFEELATTMYNVAPVASSMGVQFTEVNAALEAMTKQGVPTAQATTQLRQVMVELQKPGKELAAILAEIGIVDAKAAVESRGLGAVLADLADYAADSGMSFNQMFSSVEAAAAANLLAGKNAEFFTQALQNQAGATGAADAAFVEMNKSFSQQWKVMQGQLQRMMITIGSELLPVVTPVIQAIGEKLPAAMDAAMPIIRAMGETIRFYADALAKGDIEGAINKLWTAIEEAAPRVGEQLGIWGRQFVEWIGPRIPPMLQELGKLAGQALEWIKAQVPLLVKQFQHWAHELIAWIAPMVLPMLQEASVLFGRFMAWITEQGPPLAYKFVSEWVPAAIEWVARAAVDIIPKLVGLVAVIGAWIITEGVPKILLFGWEMGKAIIGGLIDGAKSLANDLLNALLDLLEFDFGWVKLSARSGVSFNIPTPSISLPGFGGGAAGEHEPGGAIYEAWVAAGSPDYRALAEAEMPGFQYGGSFVVPGRGGADSQVVAFRATPGEQVTISPPGQGGVDYDRLAAALAAQPIVIHLDGREVARVARGRLLQERTALGSLGLGLS